MEWKQKIRKWFKTPSIPLRENVVVSFSLKDYAMVPLTVAKLLDNITGSLLLVTSDEAKMDALASSLETFRQIIGDERMIIPLPEVAVTRRQWVPENEAGRCAALDAALNGKIAIYITTAQVLISQTLSPKNFQKKILTLKVGQDISPEKLAKCLVELDYDNEYEIQAPGEFARRGGIFDIYSPLYDAPVRLEFWGDTIDSMRFFLPDSQRSFKEVKELRVVPRGSVVLESEETESSMVWEFFDQKIPLVICSPLLVSQQLEQFGAADAVASWQQLQAQPRTSFLLETEPEELAVHQLEEQTAKRRKSRAPRPSGDEEETAQVAPSSTLSLDAQPLDSDSVAIEGDFAMLNLQLLRDNLLNWHKRGFTIVACCADEGEMQRFQELLQENQETAKLPVTIEKCPLDTGLFFPGSKLVLLSSKEIFGRKPKVRRRRAVDYHYDQHLRDSIELEEGSLAVHAAYGICRYRGIVCKEMGSEVVEAMELEFANDGRLFVPLEQAQLVSRYLGGSKSAPELSQLSGSAWNRKKEKAADAAWDLAAELLRLEAMRQSCQGTVMHPVQEWENTFAQSFQYVETPDQNQAIQDVMADLANPKPMDRLLCGDVGYGKTEVAMRAAFRTVMNGHQVALLVPTTVLAQQHYQSFCERMRQYPINIEMLSRFRSKKEQKEIIAKLERGEIDLIIGTHALIQPEVKFASLGLLIIDEEQRFGVKHKQRLKSLRASLDILTMTATPIPRTLYFSLSGIRNLSTIMTPPVDRLPVKTVVAYNDNELIKQAIMRELERKGQVFFLYNRVSSISEYTEKLMKLVPQARFGIAHGRMTASELEEVMTDFVAGKFDVLVCTTIIESGIDIPNVNTIIIDHADRFGLSELYQLRGRVGRYHRQAYAYLLLPPMGILPANARQRLAAIRRYTQLGAGFKLAMKDLEIRGAGNILGTEQSGHIAAVGFDLYCQLLKEAVAKLENREIPKIIPVHVDFDLVTSSIKEVAGLFQSVIQPEYIQDEFSRIDTYKRIQGLNSFQAVDDFAKELEDRFGPLPKATALLLLLTKIRILGQSRKFLRIVVRQGKLIIETPTGLYRINNSLPQLSSTTDPTAQANEILQLFT